MPGQVVPADGDAAPQAARNRRAGRHASLHRGARLGDSRSPATAAPSSAAVRSRHFA